jgi:hypothetical protein
MSADDPIKFSPHRNNLVAFLGMLVSEINNTARGSNIEAQLALGRYGHLELRSNGGIEAGAGCRSVLEFG